MTDEQIAKQLLKQYKKDDTGILLTPDVVAQFIALFREAVVDFSLPYRKTEFFREAR